MKEQYNDEWCMSESGTGCYIPKELILKRGGNHSVELFFANKMIGYIDSYSDAYGKTKYQTRCFIPRREKTFNEFIGTSNTDGSTHMDDDVVLHIAIIGLIGSARKYYLCPENENGSELMSPENFNNICKSHCINKAVGIE